MNQKASIAVILSGVLWGTISIFIRTLSAAGLSSMEIAVIRMIVAAFLFTGTVAVKDKSLLKVHLRDLWMFVGTGIISVVFFNYCYFSTIVNSEASIAVVLLYTSPVFVMLLSAILFHEKITRRKLAALALTVTGCVLVAGLAGGGSAIRPQVLLTGLGSGLFYALYTIFGRVALKKYDTMTVTAYTFLFGMLGTLPIGDLPHVWSVISADYSLILWCLGVGIFCTVLPYFFYTWGLQRLESGKAAILAAVEPLVGTVIGMTVFQESREPLKLLGIVLILSAIVLLQRSDKA